MIDLKRISEKILSAFFPDRCSVCGEVVERGEVICHRCKKAVFSIDGDICHFCAAGVDDHIEGRCEHILAPVIAAFYYRDNVRNLIIDFKDTRKIKYFDFFSSYFYEKIAYEYCDKDFDLVTCVPSRDGNKSTSEIICEETAKHFFLPCDILLLEKYRETKKQHMLSMNERFTNLENSIRVCSEKETFVKGKTILLCDDVKTTGTTLNECAKALFQAGAKEIYCACIAVSDYGIKKY